MSGVNKIPNQFDRSKLKIGVKFSYGKSTYVVRYWDSEDLIASPEEASWQDFRFTPEQQNRITMLP